MQHIFTFNIFATLKRSSQKSHSLLVNLEIFFINIFQRYLGCSNNKKPNNLIHEHKKENRNEISCINCVNHPVPPPPLDHPQVSPPPDWTNPPLLYTHLHLLNLNIPGSILADGSNRIELNRLFASAPRLPPPSSLDPGHPV